MSIGKAPEGAIAWKYADPTEDGRWVYDLDDLEAVKAQDPSLIEYVPVEILLRRGLHGAMQVEARGGATIEYDPSGSSYDGIEEDVAIITGPGEYRVKEWDGDDFAWGEWTPC